MKIKKYQQFNEELLRLENYKCPICRSELYRTDAGGRNVTLQCSSPEAMFWNFPRGTEDQKKAHDHFMKSTTYVSSEEWNKFSKDVKNTTGPIISPDNAIEPIPSSKART